MADRRRVGPDRLAVDHQRDLDDVGVGRAAVLLDGELDQGVAIRVVEEPLQPLQLALRIGAVRSGTSMFFPLTIVLTLPPGRREVSPTWVSDRLRRDRRVRPAAPRVYTRAGSGPGGRPPNASPLAGNGDRGDADRARLEEGRGAGRERGAGRDDVVDEHDPATRQRPLGPAASRAARLQPERSGDVGRPLRPVEVELGGRGPCPLEDRRARQAESSRAADLARSAPPGRSRAGAPGPRGPGPAPGRRRPPPTRRQRRASAAPSGTASRCSPAYLSSWSALRTRPVNGAHHSSWSRGAGTSDGSPIGTPGGAPAARRALAGTPHRSADPPRRSLGTGRERKIERAGGEAREVSHARHHAGHRSTRS